MVILHTQLLNRLKDIQSHHLEEYKLKQHWIPYLNCHISKDKIVGYITSHSYISLVAV